MTNPGVGRASTAADRCAWCAALLMAMGCTTPHPGGPPASSSARVQPDQTWTAFSVPGVRGAAVADSSTVGLIVTVFHWSASHNPWGAPMGISFLDPATQQRILGCVEERARTVNAFANKVATCAPTIEAADTAVAPNQHLEERLEHEVGMEPFDFYQSASCMFVPGPPPDPDPPPITTGASGDLSALRNLTRAQSAGANVIGRTACELKGIASNTTARIAMRGDSAVATVAIQGNSGWTIQLNQYCLLAVRSAGSWAVVRGGPWNSFEHAEPSAASSRHHLSEDPCFSSSRSFSSWSG